LEPEAFQNPYSVYPKIIMLGVRGEKKMYTMLANPLFFEYGFVELTRFRSFFFKGKSFTCSRVVRLCHDKKMCTVNYVIDGTYENTTS
ncbi:hypothetical protein T07_7644, partial [Trichinella nelsoni]